MKIEEAVAGLIGLILGISVAIIYTILFYG